MDAGEWKDRLKAAIERDGRSYRKISMDAGISENYVHQFMKYGKLPGAEVVVRLCKALGISATYLFTGAELDQESEPMLALFAKLSPEQKQQFLLFLQSLQPGA